jgi:hypothetical protein
MYGRSPDGDRWHRLADGKTLCCRGRSRGLTTGEWELRDRLPPRHDDHCGHCFPGHVPAQDQPAVVTRPAAWDLDAFLEDL